MRHQTSEFVQQFLEKHKPDFKSVLEVGSLDVNGHIRGLFEGKAYVGLDMRDGPNVDVLLDAHKIKSQFEPEQFDMVICFDTLEHDNKFWVTLENMKWVLKKGGWLLLGVPSRTCPLHGHPSDYWRFMEPAMTEMLQPFEDIHVELQRDNPDTEDEIMGYGRKPI